VEVAKPEEPTIVVALQQAPVIAVAPTGETVELAQVVQSEPAPVATLVNEPAPTTQSLPGTASSLPLIALCGLLALGGAMLTRSIKNRT